MKLVQAFNKRRGEIFDRMRLTNTKKQDWYTGISSPAHRE